MNACRILVIDDNAEMRDTMGLMLKSAGYEVDLAANGIQGAKLQQASPADLIITDLLMPGKAGLETIIEFRRDFPQVPVIAMSGTPRGGFYLVMADGLGAAKTLEKPFRPNELLTAVQDVLRA
jgi:DNA-binding response OmpR family regulator